MECRIATRIYGGLIAILILILIVSLQSVIIPLIVAISTLWYVHALYAKRTIELLGNSIPEVRFPLIIIALPLLLMYTATYRAYQLSMIVICIILFSWLISRIISSKHDTTKRLLSILIFLIMFTAAFRSSVTFNFFFTAWARQRVVDRVLREFNPNDHFLRVKYDNPLTRLLLGRAIAYADEKSISVHFNYYKSFPFTREEAFIIYTSDPNNIKSYLQHSLTRLKKDWFFQTRGYDD